MTRTSTHGLQLVSIICCFSLAVASLSNGQLPTDLTAEILQGKSVNDESGSTQADSSTTIQVPDASPVLFTVTPHIIIQEEEEQLYVGPIGEAAFQEVEKAKDAIIAIHDFTNIIPGCACEECKAALAKVVCPDNFLTDNPATKSCDRCPGSQCSGCCPVDMPETNFTAEDSTHVGFVRNKHVESCFDDCKKIAESLSNSLSDPHINAESRRLILESTMKLLVRNAELEAEAKISQMQLEHEREMAVMRGTMLQMQTHMATTGEIRNWMGPIYTNQNQTQKQVQDLMTNLQLINRTLRLLEKEKATVDRIQQSQAERMPVPHQRYSNPILTSPERWSQLPTFSQPQALPRTNKSTMQMPPLNHGMKTNTQSAPPRLSDKELRQEQLEKEIKRLQGELHSLDGDGPIRPVSWNEPLPSNPLKPLPQPLQPVSEFANQR